MIDHVIKSSSRVPAVCIEPGAALMGSIALRQELTTSSNGKVDLVLLSHEQAEELIMVLDVLLSDHR